MTVKFLVRIPDGKYCSNSRMRCPCLGGNEDYDDHCQLFGRELIDKATGLPTGLRCVKCEICAKKVTKMKKAQP